MTKADYSWTMSGTPSSPDYINTRALEGFVRSFDHAVMGKCGLHAEPQKQDPELQELEQQVIRKLLAEEARSQRKEKYRLTFWQTFPPINFFRRLRDNIRLRRYNREWIKKNIH